MSCWGVVLTPGRLPTELPAGAVLGSDWLSRMDMGGACCLVTAGLPNTPTVGGVCDDGGGGRVVKSGSCEVGRMVEVVVEEGGGGRVKSGSCEVGRMVEVVVEEGGGGRVKSGSCEVGRMVEAGGAEVRRGRGGYEVGSWLVGRGGKSRRDCREEREPHLTV